MTKKKKDTPVLPGKTAQKSKGHSVQNSPGPPPAPPKITSAAIATSLGVHVRTVEGWIAKGCPKTTLDEVIRWRARNMRADRQPMNQRAGVPDGEAPGHTLQEKRLLADTAKIVRVR